MKPDGSGTGGRPRGPAAWVARAVLLALFPATLAAQAPAAADTTPHSEGELVAERTGIRPGEPFTVGLHITLDRGWHTYWVNAGDSGTPALIDWQLPDGFEAGPIQWPVPERVPYPPLMSYAFHDEVLLPVEITAPTDLVPGATVRLEADTEWLVCEEICLVAHKAVSLELPVTAGPEPSRWSDAFADTRREMPVAAPDWELAARAVGDSLFLGISPPAGRSVPAESYFFPLDSRLLEHADPQPVGRAGTEYWMSLPRSPYLSELPDTLAGVLSLADRPVDAAGHTALEVRVPVEPGPAPEIAAWVQPVAAADGGLALFVALGFAFLGGLLLNLMPCVFPVLSLKVLGFVKHAAGDRARMRNHGLVFGAGVVLSFLAVAGILLAIRATGPEVGWGYQLQSPVIVALLAFLMVAIGLNFLGLLEFGSSMTRLGRFGGEDEGYRSSFLTGILAVLVATPCTAPFMGSAVGAALVRPAAEGLAIFAGLGVGMATPYAVLSAWPALLDRLPRPGPWMETLRQALAFPMLAVAAWLLWVLGLQVGVGGATAVLYALLLFAFGAWLLSRARGTKARGLGWVGRVAAVAALAGALVWGVLAARSEAVAATGTGADGNGAGVAAEWIPFEPDVVRQFQARGRPVFVDFTAAWCITCQVNERVVLSAAPVMAAFRDHDIALVRADWTRRDEVIGRALTELGRSGVPVYALYPAEPGAPPELLPSVLTIGIVLNALDRLPESNVSD